MPFIRNLLFQAARRIAADPEVQAKASDVYQSEVRPRAQHAIKETKSRLSSARDEIADVAAEVDPRDDPAEFAFRLRDRLLGRDLPEDDEPDDR